MDIAVVGGTGLLGRRVVAGLRSGGHAVRVLSRTGPEHRVDLTTGAGLARALDGAAVVVDASNRTGTSAAARSTLVGGTARLLEAEAAAGVAHHVCVSIVNCDEVPLGYYRAKADQERLVERGRTPWTIVRATQFHEFVAASFLAPLKRLGVHAVPGALLQPVDTSEAADAVVRVATAEPTCGLVEITGPRAHELGELARLWRESNGSRALPLPVRVPGALGRALRAGALTVPGGEDRGTSGVLRGTTTFEEWLRSRRSAPNAEHRAPTETP
ncbi:NAD(P)H-binding protein [Streptomyces sp. XM4193]|uniref:SDR family oxidoreductase n=1 Tax=Streptomyces sp. XM4193 TaxID=2929782 RepID=UPI001FF76280|nr:NAD(P)H-binding protein [Streptomyces sp. XM4193]MCK1798458.1 NAD(P)H-binding protein [Streptomyces sp. XM4193]